MKKGFSVVEAVVIISIILIIGFYAVSYFGISFNIGLDEECVREFKGSDEYKKAIRDCMIYTDDTRYYCKNKVLRAQCDD